MTKSTIEYLFLCWIATIMFAGCSKPDGGQNPPTPTPPTQPPVTPVPSNCILSGISQVNSGTKTEFALTALYDVSSNVKRISAYDSTTSESTFRADFNYVTADSIVIDPYQYIKLDAGKRVILFSTKSDLVNPSIADDYKCKYSYNSQGYLTTRDVYINNYSLPNFSTSYTYTNNLLTNSTTRSVSSGNLKVMESDITYDNTINIKNWIYTFPDATIESKYTSVLNFGNRAVYPVKKVVTKIYNPLTGVLMDTWTTNYGAYRVSENGNVTYGEATGDLQQGIAVFFGKTHFYYNCQ